MLMNINEYQQQLERLETVELEQMELEPQTLRSWLIQNRLPLDCKPFLKDVTELGRFDHYYCTYERHGESKTYRRVYNEMKRYSYPMSNVSYNNGVFPQVPHIKFNGAEHRLPNEVIVTLESVWQSH